MVDCGNGKLPSELTNAVLFRAGTYLESITFAGRAQKQHDCNLDLFVEAAGNNYVTSNPSNCVFPTDTLGLLVHDL